jgi:hypothetical protein
MFIYYPSTLKEITFNFTTILYLRLAEAFLSLFSHTDGKIQDEYGGDGCGRKMVDSEGWILTQPHLSHL